MNGRVGLVHETMSILRIVKIVLNTHTHGNVEM